MTSTTFCASSSLAMLAQGSEVICLNHDTLEFAKRFSGHKERVVWMKCNNSRAQDLVVSYDTSNTAIVWDPSTGIEIARFLSTDYLRTASWMLDGSIAFGTLRPPLLNLLH